MSGFQELTQLPNKDLWRGYNPKVVGSSNVELTVEEQGTALAKAIAAVLKAKGNNDEFPCLWCDQQFPDQDTILAHLKSRHASVVNPPSAADAALHAARKQAVASKPEIVK